MCTNSSWATVHAYAVLPVRLHPPSMLVTSTNCQQIYGKHMYNSWHHIQSYMLCFFSAGHASNTRPSAHKQQGIQHEPAAKLVLRISSLLHFFTHTLL